MKNILFIIVDSLSYDRIHTYSYVGKMTPFLDSIKDKCITTTNLFSQGPYTEAGTKGLLCCCNTLDNGGYFNRYDTQDKFITDIFKDMGFETYNINAPSYLLSKRTLNNIDHMFYTTGFDCRFLWSQRFEFYYDRWANGLFSEEDYQYLARFVQLVFETFDDFLSENKRQEKYDIIKDLIDADVQEQNIRILEQEKIKFENNKKSYIDSVFTEKLKHPIFTVKNINISKMINTPLVSQMLCAHSSLTRKIKHKQFVNNLINNHCYRGVLRRTIQRIVHDKKISKNNCGELLNRLRNLVSGREIEVYHRGLYYNGDPYKLIPSARTQFKYAVSLIEKCEKNSFIFLHTEEPHYFNTFFTYDTSDKTLLEQEFNDAESYIDSLGKDYRGSIYYDLSVRYIDRQIEKLYCDLEKKGYLKDTLVVITADHGSSYFFDPIRDKLVNNMHSENYHVPLYIFGNEVTGRQYENMCMSKDIIPTIASLCNQEISGNFSGHSILDDSFKRENIMIEFMGPGCPDIRLKPVWLSNRSERYVVSYIGPLKESFDENRITEIFDLKEDPREQNSRKELRNGEINRMIAEIKRRFDELQSEETQG